MGGCGEPLNESTVGGWVGWWVWWGVSGWRGQAPAHRRRGGREGRRWVRKTGVRNVGLCGQGGKGEGLTQGGKVRVEEVLMDGGK